MFNKLKKNKLFALYLILILCFSLFALVFFVYDSDYFWHIKAGEKMVKNFKVLTHDVFSWYIYGKYWMSHEWLFEILIYLLSVIFGKYHVYVYCFLAFLILQLSFFLFNKKSYLNNIPFSMLWLSLSTLLCFYLQARPHLISFCLFSFTILILFELYNNENSKKYLFFPFLSFFWVNFHGGSSNLIYLLPMIFLFSGLFSFESSKIISKKYSKLQIKKYIICIILGFLPLFLNPHGVKMIIYPYENMGNTVMLSNIAEWQCSDLNNFSHYPYFVLALFIFLILIFSKKKIRFLDFVLFLFTLYLGLKSIRFWPFLYISMSYCIWYYVPKRKLDSGTNMILILLSCIFIALFCFFRPNINSYKLLDDAAIKNLKKINAKRLFNYYDYGGYLIYNDISVFVDGRADLYSEYNYNDYLSISSLKSDYVKLIKKYNFDYFIIPKESGLATYLNSVNCNLIYFDDNVAIYQNNYFAENK